MNPWVMGIAIFVLLIAIIGLLTEKKGGATNERRFIVAPSEDILPPVNTTPETLTPLSQEEIEREMSDGNGN